MSEDLPISQLNLSGATQPRAGLRQDVIDDYAADMRRGDHFPPVTVFYDGEDYWVADGHHRVHAARQAGRERIEAEIRQGTRADARWHSYSVNGSHGARRTAEDKARQVRGALLHPKGAALSDRQIAAHVGVDHKTVAKARSQLEATGEIPSQATRLGADGRTINVTGIGGSPAPSHQPDEPGRLEQPDIRPAPAVPVPPEAGLTVIAPAMDRARVLVETRPGRAVAFAPWAEPAQAPAPAAIAVPAAPIAPDGPGEAPVPGLDRHVRRWLNVHYHAGQPWIEILDQIVAGSDGGSRALDAMLLSPFIPCPRRREDLMAACRRILADLRTPNQARPA
jgi:hypothetical protein